MPERLQAAVAQVLGNGKARQAYLKKSLGTKDLKTANVRAKPVLAAFDRTFSAAAALAEPVAAVASLRQSLSAIEITRVSEYVFAKELAWNERFRVGGRAEMQRLEVEVRGQYPGEPLEPWAFPYETLPQHGLSAAQLRSNREELADSLSMMREALALGNISAVEDHIADALEAFGIIRRIADSKRASPQVRKVPED